MINLTNLSVNSTEISYQLANFDHLTNLSVEFQTNLMNNFMRCRCGGRLLFRLSGDGCHIAQRG